MTPSDVLGFALAGEEILQLGGKAEKAYGPWLMNHGSHPASRIRQAFECDQ